MIYLYRYLNHFK